MCAVNCEASTHKSVNEVVKFQNSSYDSKEYELSDMSKRQEGSWLA